MYVDTKMYAMHVQNQKGFSAAVKKFLKTGSVGSQTRAIFKCVHIFNKNTPSGLMKNSVH